MARTLVDLASYGLSDRLRKAFEDAERLQLLNLNDVREVLSNRGRGARGRVLIGALLADLEPAPMTRSELERAFWHFTRARGLPKPSCNVMVAGQIVDFFWAEGRLVVELDSRSFHGHWSAAERDRVRDANLLRNDIACLRVTNRRLRSDPDGIAGDIRARLNGRRPPI